MNKIFKVVWSKTKECYVVVSEVAKNNSGKKKVLASVLAALAVVGAGAAGTPVQAATDYNKKVNISPTGTMAGGYSANNSVSDNSIVVGYGNDTSTGAQGNGHVAYGFGNTSTEDTSTALGGGNKATGPASTAVGSFNEATARAAIAMGNVSKATGERSVAIGSGAEATQAETIAVGREAKATAGQTVAIGRLAKADQQYATAMGYNAQATGSSSLALGRDSSSSGSSSVAVGYTNKAKQNVAVALGVNNDVDGEESTAVGSSNTIATNANQASVIGRKNKVNRAGSFVGGFSNVTNGERNVAVGSENTTAGEESIGIGTKVIAGTGKTIAIGGVYNPGGGVEKQTIARGDDTINPATGQVNNVFALAIGNGAQADGKDNKASGMIAIGQDVLANNTNAMALGIQAKATGRSSMAFGQAANAAGSGAFALGQSANATSHGSIAMGNGAQSTGSGSTALGRTAKALNDGTVALGFSAEATGDGAIAIGGDGKGAAFDSTNTTFAGLGEKTTATAKNAVAVGHQATASIAGGVALGSESKTTKDAGEIGYNPAAGRTNKYDNLTNNTKAALTSTRAAVSIGDDSTSVTRQLTGLAAGTQDTDAVNVAQLKAVNLKFAGDSTQVTGSTDVRLNDGTFNVNGDGTLISTEATATGIKVKAKVGGTINNTDGKAVKPTTNGIATTDNVADAINDSYWKATAGGNTDGTPAVGKVKPGTQVTYSAGDNLKVKQTINNTTGDQEYKYSLNPVLTGITSIANTATGPKMTFGGNSINITGGSLDMGNNKITNLATGTDDKDAVNVKQLKDTEIHITPGTYTPDSNKKVTLTYENGDNKTVAGKTAVIDLSGLATGGTASTEKVKKAANGANDTNIAEVNPKTGDTFGDAGATYEVSVSRNAVKDAAREAVTINNGGTKSGTTYTPNADNPITVTPKEDAANHNTTYEVTFDGNKAAKQIPLTYKATNNGTTTADQTVKLDKGLNFTGGDYTTASVGADGKVTFDVNLGTAPTVTDGKPGVPGQAGAAGKDGIATVKTVVDTINNSGWKANAKANGGNLDGSATATVVKPGNTVNYAAGKNITVKQELETDGAGALTGNQTYTYSLNKDIDLTSAGSLTVGDTTVNNGGITIKAPTPAAGTTPTTDVKLTNAGLDNGGNKIVNVKDGDVSATSKDAVNGSQLHAVKTAERHIAPTTAGHEYTVDSNGDVTMTYLDGNNNAVTGEQAVIKGIAKNDLSNITNEGKKVITGLSNKVVAGDNVTVDETEDATTKQKTYKVNAKLAKLEDGTNTTVSGNGTAANPYHVNVAGDLTGISSITNGGTNNGKISFGPSKTVTVDGDHSITLNASTGTIGGLQNKTFDPTNITSGQAATEDQLKSVHDTLKASELHIAPTAVKTGSTENKGGTASGSTNVYKYDATNKTVTLTYNDGNGNAVTDTKAVIDFSALNTGGTAASTWTAKTSAESTTAGAEVGKHVGDTSQVINDQKSVDFQAGRNMTVKQTNDGNGNTTINYALDKDLTNLDKVVVNGENGTNGKDGVTIIGPQGATGATGMPGTNGIDGKVGITGKDGKDAVSISGKDGIGTIGLTGPQGPAGADGRGVDITTDHGTQTLTKPEANNGGKSERIVYVPKDKDGNPLKDTDGNTIKREVATMDDGLKFTGNNESTENKHKLGSLVKVQGEGVTENTTTNKLEANGEEFKSASGNIAVVADSIDKLTVKLNKNLAGINKISNGNSSITLNDTPSATTPAVTISGGNLSMGDGTHNNKIVNVAPGTDDSDAVNYKQLKEAKTEVKAGENVTVKHTTDATDNHNIYTVSAVTPAVYTKADGTKVYKIVDPTTGAVTWNTSPDGTGTVVNAGDVITSFESPANGTTPGSTTGGNMIVNNVGSAIKNLGNTGDNYLTKLDLANNATPNAAVNVSDLKNTADALKANERHIAPTTVATGSTESKGGTTVGTENVYKYDATTKKVTLTYNDGKGNAVTDTKAVIDFSALNTGGTGASSWNIASDKVSATEGAVATGSAGTQNIADGKTVTMKAGKNLTVNQTNDGAGNASVAFSLDKNLENLDKVVVNGNDGATGQAGVSIVGPKGANGVDGNDGKVGIAGKDGKDAVSISGKDGVGHIGLQGPKGTPGTPGADGASLDITTDHGTQTLVKPEANNNNQSERIVYVPKDANGNPLKDTDGNDIKREVATMDDGLKFTGNNESTENKHKLGSLVKVQGEGVTENTTTNKLEANGEEFKSASGNIAVVADSIDKLTVKLNKNLAGINKISNGNSSITLNDTPSATTPAVTISGGNLSMGDGTHNNKIVNVAPGTDDSDAVNYKQLKEAKTEVKAGENVTVKHTTDATDNHNIYTVSAVTPAVYTKADGTKVYKIVDPTTGAVTWNTSPDGTGTVVNAGDVITSFESPANGTTPGSTTGGNMIVNNVGSAIKNLGNTGDNYLTKLDLANNATPNAAVNVSDLKNTADALKANERHIAPTTVATGSTESKGGTTVGTENVYKYDATTKKVTLTYNDGKGNAVTDTKAVIDFSALNTGGTGASSWNIASDKVSATEGAVATGSAGTQNIADGKTVTMKAGKNLTVNQTNDGAGNASVAFSLDKNLENLDKVVVNGNDGATGQAGVSIVGPKGANGVDGNDGKVGIAGKDGKDAVSISGKDGVGHIGLQGPKGTPGTPGADGASLDITTDHGTQTLVKPEANNNNQSERIVYVPKDANGNPLKDTDGNDIKREVATMDDGLKFTGNNESTENKQKLGSLVKVQGEGTKESTAVDPATGKKYVVLSDGTTKFESAKDNIAVEADGTDTLTVKLNKNLKGLNSIQLGGNTIQSNGDNITFTTNGGNTKTVATTDQLWTIQANGTDVPAKDGKVNLVAGDHITITPDATNGKMTISATGFGSMDGFNVKTSAESATVGTHAGDTTENIKNGKTVDMQAGKNLVVTQTNDGNGNTTVNYALNKDVDLGTNGSLKTGDTTINNDGFKNGNTTVGGNGMTIKNPTDPTKTVSLTKDGLNNGGNQITNVASGGNVDTNAANIGDIKRLAKDTRIKDGTYTVDNNGTVELTYVDGAGNQVKDASGNAITAKITGLTTLDSTRVNVAVNETGSGKAVGSTTPVKVTKGTEFVAGDNLIVERKAHTGNDLDNSVVYSLNKDLKGIETIQNGDNTKITLHNVPTSATDPTAVTINGGNINMGGNRIVNVAPAKAGTDAVNLDQLKAARTKVTSNDGTVSVNRSENTATGEITYDLHVTPGQSPDLTRITNKVDQLGEEIGRVGAQGAALSALKPIQYDPLEPTQIMAGYGNYRGNSAVALGVAHYKNESTLIHGGVSWAGGSSHMMANAGVTWKVGNRDSEAAVADRYRKGPISSAYAMQQEMAAMKAQNAGLKGEVSDLKAENEQMKAQIAAMMAKLGL